jgi:hypothetical protein
MRCKAAASGRGCLRSRGGELLPVEGEPLARTPRLAVAVRMKRSAASSRAGRAGRSAASFARTRVAVDREKGDAS